MVGLPLDVVSDICDQLGAGQRAFLSETTLDRYRRACAWSMSEVAKGACREVTEAIDDAFESPTHWMRKAFDYTRALSANRDEVEADLFVLPSQSIVMKYGMGSGPQIRRPGDVGLTKDTIYVPNWKNLQLTQGIHRNRFDNLPGGVAARLVREALGQRAKRQLPGRWGVYKGQLDVGGSRIMGYIARPPRGTAPIGKNGRSIVVNLGRPRALLVAIQQATYEPRMQKPCDAALKKAVGRTPVIMEGELRDAMEYRARRGDMRPLGAAA